MKQFNTISAASASTTSPWTLGAMPCAAVFVIGRNPYRGDPDGVRAAGLSA